ncbi:hypothetical protein [Botrimarina hoheduenensis]|uniref:Uncharacterized protein n=1 Tax=Botrimarina hoheduenensis TaxID=2528000 RepID=A0A5C5W982_9BACT|nr:hypothetical protein [Botrimarina hoheduenensis]TWT47174.1 hypothetical protein Pla111_07850 [Botrimarina hoheduenensis]
MDSVWPTIPAVVWIVTHLCGVVAAWLSRLPLSSRAAAFARGGLAGSFVGVACFALFNPQTETLGWVGSAATLGVMTIAAVWDTARGDAAEEDLTLSRLIAVHELSLASRQAR